MFSLGRTELSSTGDGSAARGEVHPSHASTFSLSRRPTVSSMKKGLRRVAVVAVATLVAAPALATVASATSTFAFDRLQGIDRYATSVATAASFGASTNVILASGVAGHYPDALTASSLAGFKKAPIMLTKLAATPANALARIAASGATDVWLIGCTDVISAAQETALGAT